MRKKHKKKAEPRRKQDRKVVKVERIICKVHPGWIFEKTPTGTRRTCTTCGYEVTEIGRNVTITPVTGFYPVRRHGASRERKQISQ